MASLCETAHSSTHEGRPRRSPRRPHMLAALQRSGTGARTPQASVRAGRLLAQCSHPSPDLLAAQALQHSLLPRHHVDHLTPAALCLCSRGLRCFVPPPRAGAAPRLEGVVQRGPALVAPRARGRTGRLEAPARPRHAVLCRGPHDDQAGYAVSRPCNRKERGTHPVLSS